MTSGGIHISPDNQGPILNVISWILLVLTCLATLAKVWSKWSLIQKLQADDFYLIGAMFTAAGWIAAVSVQVDSGLGRHLQNMNPDDVERYQQAAYSSQFLYVLSLFLARMAILDFMFSLARQQNRRMAVNATVALNIAVTIVGIFAVAFQCPLPRPWTVLSRECFNQTSFWIAYGVMDIVVDSATVVLPFFLLHDLRTTWKRKLPAIVAFALRFLIIPMIIIRLVFIKSASKSADHPHSDFAIIMATSVQINFSVLFTCLPFLKIVVDNIQSGFLAGDLRMRSRSQTYAYKLEKKGNPPSDPYSITSTQRQKSVQHNILPIMSNVSPDEETPNRDSGASTERMVINQTTTISVRTDSKV